MRIAGLTRHPIKGVGSESVASVNLQRDRPLPGDRAWAIAHAGHPGGDGWRPRGDFTVVAAGPALAAVTAESDGDRVTLHHPDRPTTRFDLPDDADALIDWLAPLWPDTRPAASRLCKAPLSTGMPDNGIASLSILTQASLDALSGVAGVPLDPRRFRGNVLIDGATAWAEFDWIGKRIRLGEATLEVLEPIERCRATEADPDTGVRDVNTLAHLRDGFGHRDFGVYARVVDGGRVATGDAAVLL